MWPSARARGMHTPWLMRAASAASFVHSPIGVTCSTRSTSSRAFSPRGPPRVVYMCAFLCYRYACPNPFRSCLFFYGHTFPVVFVSELDQIYLLSVLISVHDGVPDISSENSSACSNISRRYWHSLQYQVLDNRGGGFFSFSFFLFGLGGDNHFLVFPEPEPSHSNCQAVGVLGQCTRTAFYESPQLYVL